MITDREAIEAAQAASHIAPSGEISMLFLLAYAGEIERKVRTEEREACAQVCIDWGNAKVAKWEQHQNDEMLDSAKASAWDGLCLARLIRERGE